VDFNVRLDDERLAALVVEDGYRESKESWLSVLRDLKSPRHARACDRDGRRRARILGALRENRRYSISVIDMASTESRRKLARKSSRQIEESYTFLHIGLDWGASGTWAC
jgi:hypothetical protein